MGLSPLNPDLLAVCRWRLPPSFRRQEGRFSPRVRHVPSHHPRNRERRCVCLLNPDLLPVCRWRLPPSLGAEEGRCSPRERGLEESTRPTALKKRPRGRPPKTNRGKKRKRGVNTVSRKNVIKVVVRRSNKGGGGEVASATPS